MALLYYVLCIKTMYYVLNYVLNSHLRSIWLRYLRRDDRKDQILWNSETQKHGP